LAGCYRISLQLAAEHGLKHIVSYQKWRSHALVAAPAPLFQVSSDTAEAPHFYLYQAFPSISTGIYSYPVDNAAHVALCEVRKFLDSEDAKEACLVLSCIAARGTKGARASFSSSA
jgi:O-acetyl-ADP-ribose deacetylase (regulator of RNase III)